MGDPVSIGRYAFRYDGQRWRSANLATATASPYDTAQVMIPEIERLRAENQAHRDTIVNWQTEHQMEHAERLRLQALIDALAVAYTDDLRGWWAAVDAILAAATKGDDRG